MSFLATRSRLLALLICLAAPRFLCAQSPVRVVHVYVALADNQSQGIVPVPARLGNGDAPATNPYFAPYLKSARATPLLWTTGLMAPEAYTLKAALDGWIANEDGESVRQR